MSLPTSLHAYPQELDAFERAMASERGVRYPFPTEASAYRFRSRLHQARALQRKANSEALEPGHPLWGRCEWDTFDCLLRYHDDQHWVYIRKIEALEFVAEELTEETYNPPRAELKTQVLLPPQVLLPSYGKVYRR